MGGVEVRLNVSYYLVASAFAPGRCAIDDGHVMAGSIVALTRYASTATSAGRSGELVVAIASYRCEIGDQPPTANPV